MKCNWGGNFEPENAETVLTAFVHRSTSEIVEVAKSIVKSEKLDFDEKMKGLDAIKNAPIFQTVNSDAPAEQTVPDRMELSFLLNHLLNSNFLRHFNIVNGTLVQTSKEVVHQMPGTEFYPPKISFRPRIEYEGPAYDYASQTRRDFEAPGIYVGHRINELWTTYLDKIPLFQSTSEYYSPDETVLLHRARWGLDKLARMARPLAGSPAAFNRAYWHY